MDSWKIFTALTMKASAILVIFMLCSIESSVTLAQIPASDASVVACKIVSRTFNNIDSLDGATSLKAGFVQYVEASSNPMNVDRAILDQLKALYKPGVHVDDPMPMLPPLKAVVIFDKERKPKLLISIFGGPIISIRRVLEVDANCYQGLRSDPKSCTLSDRELADWFSKSVQSNEQPPIDLTDWRKGTGATSKPDGHKDPKRLNSGNKK